METRDSGAESRKSALRPCPPLSRGGWRAPIYSLAPHCLSGGRGPRSGEGGLPKARRQPGADSQKLEAVRQQTEAKSLHCPTYSLSQNLNVSFSPSHFWSLSLRFNGVPSSRVYPSADGVPIIRPPVLATGCRFPDHSRPYRLRHWDARSRSPCSRILPHRKEPGSHGQSLRE